MNKQLYDYFVVILLRNYTLLTDCASIPCIGISQDENMASFGRVSKKYSSVLMITLGFEPRFVVDPPPSHLVTLRRAFAKAEDDLDE